MERDLLSTFPHFFFISFLSIHFLYQNCHILSQNVKYGTFVANVTKNITYTLWENNSGSKWVPDSSASCAGLNGNRTKTKQRTSISFLTFHIYSCFSLRRIVLLHGKCIQNSCSWKCFLFFHLLNSDELLILQWKVDWNDDDNVDDNDDNEYHSDGDDHVDDDDGDDDDRLLVGNCDWKEIEPTQ